MPRAHPLLGFVLWMRKRQRSDTRCIGTGFLRVDPSINHLLDQTLQSLYLRVSFSSEDLDPVEWFAFQIPGLSCLSDIFDLHPQNILGIFDNESLNGRHLTLWEIGEATGHIAFQHYLL